MLDEAVEYIARDSHDAAIALLLETLDAGDSLTTMVERGRLVPELDHPELRELIVRPYRMIYRVTGDTVQVIAFVHGARDFNRLFGDPD